MNENLESDWILDWGLSANLPRMIPKVCMSLNKLILNKSPHTQSFGTYPKKSMFSSVPCPLPYDFNQPLGIPCGVPVKGQNGLTGLNGIRWIIFPRRVPSVPSVGIDPFSHYLQYCKSRKSGCTDLESVKASGYSIR